MKKVLKGIGKLLLGVLAAILVAVGVPNVAVHAASAPELVDTEGARELDAECILVLGAAVQPDGTPSAILQDRLDVGAALYFSGIAPKVVVSGNDGGGSNHEGAAMKAYLVSLGVPAGDVVVDRFGLNTYDSMWRAHNVFGVERVVVVTQAYHEYRAIFIAKGVGMEARGVSSDLHRYANQDYYDFREVLARVKDFGQVVLGAEASVGGGTISLELSGDVTG